MEHTFTNRYGAHFLLIRLDANSPTVSLASDEEYDFFIIDRAGLLSDHAVNLIASALTQFRLGWVEIFGKHAERLHDAIDRAVELARRGMEFDSNEPMTTWDEDIQDDSELASYFLSGGQGTYESKVIFVIGNDEACDRLGEFIGRAAASG